MWIGVTDEPRPTPCPTQVTTTSRGALDAIGRDETGWAHDRRVDVMLAN